jgi:hypothetical protein
MKKFEEIFKQELDQICCPEFREFLIFAFGESPTYIMDQPSSTTGKYHPPDEINDNGMIIHIKRCTGFALEIARKEKLLMFESDVVLAGCMFHDLLKMGPTEVPEKWTNGRHPAFAYKFLGECWEKYEKKTAPLKELVENLQFACLYHEGQWTNDKGTWKPEEAALLELPKTKLQKKLCKLMHDVDFFASRRSTYDIFQDTGGDYAKIRYTNS